MSPVWVSGRIPALGPATLTAPMIQPIQPVRKRQRVLVGRKNDTTVFLQEVNGGVSPRRWRRRVSTRRRCETSSNIPGLWTISYSLTGLRKGFQRSDMETLQEQFDTRVSAFLARTGLSRTRFGRMALGDPNLMRQIDGGRSLTLGRRTGFWRSSPASDGSRAARASRPAAPGCLHRERRERRGTER